MSIDIENIFLLRLDFSLGQLSGSWHEILDSYHNVELCLETKYYSEE